MMPKNYRNKDACLAEAHRLGIEGAEEMSWPQLQKAVSDALKLEELGALEPNEEEQEKPLTAEELRRIEEMEALSPYLDKLILIAPELAPEKKRLIKYEEDLGDELDIVERKFDINTENDVVFDTAGDAVDHRNKIDSLHDYASGTYKVKGRTGRKVKGIASVPKEQPGLSFRPGIDYATVVTWDGRSGYLWKHFRLPNVSDLLKQAGVYAKYRKVFKDPPNVWYACGHLVCDPHLVHRVLDEIMETARDEEVKRRTILKNLGIGVQ